MSYTKSRALATVVRAISLGAAAIALEVSAQPTGAVYQQNSGKFDAMSNMVSYLSIQDSELLDSAAKNHTFQENMNMGKSVGTQWNTPEGRTEILLGMKLHETKPTINDSNIVVSTLPASTARTESMERLLRKTLPQGIPGYIDWNSTNKADIESKVNYLASSDPKIFYTASEIRQNELKPIMVTAEVLSFVLVVSGAALLLRKSKRSN